VERRNSRSLKTSNELGGRDISPLPSEAISTLEGALGGSISATASAWPGVMKSG
jgi:hypothetical protein